MTVRISKMELDDNGRLVEQSSRMIDPSRCPHCIFVGEHYRHNGSCRCDDPDAKIMAEWGYVWQDGLWRSPEEK